MDYIVVDEERLDVRDLSVSFYVPRIRVQNNTYNGIPQITVKGYSQFVILKFITSDNTLPIKKDITVCSHENLYKMQGVFITTWNLDTYFFELSADRCTTGAYRDKYIPTPVTVTVPDEEEI